jgi:A/G-specific adenine glycosylase
MVNDVNALDVAGLRAALLGWYDGQARVLAWRVSPADRLRGVRPDPYRVWVSEVMLQQTTVAAVAGYFARFMDAFATVQDLAGAPEAEVLRLWAGLGYYSRARSLHAGAQVIAAAGGQFPETEEGWRALPGIGPYTAAAIAAIAFDRPAVVVDGNVERVISRLFAVEEPLPLSKPALRALAGTVFHGERPGDFAQAMMDLGATVCTPRSPKCLLCPISRACAARALGAPETYPRRLAKGAKPERHGAAFWLQSEAGVWLVRRPGRGLLGGMAALPSTPWTEQAVDSVTLAEHAPMPGPWRQVGVVQHVFTHFSLTLTVQLAYGGAPRGEGWWVPVAGIEAAGLPSVFAKAARVAVAAQP